MRFLLSAESRAAPAKRRGAAQPSSLCWRRHQLTRPRCALLYPSLEAGWGPRAGAAASSLFRCYFYFTLLGSGRDGSSLPLTFADCGLLCSAFTWVKGEKVGAWRTWPASGQLAEGGQSFRSSWQGLPAEQEPRHSVTQSWAYHGHRSLCSQPLSSAPLPSYAPLCQATASAGLTGARWDM